MAYETKDMTGSVFNNDKKEKENHPDRQGSCRIDGKDYWISGWAKQDRNGRPWLSLAFKPKDAKRDAAEGAPTKPRGSMKDEMDDFIPFAPEFR